MVMEGSRATATESQAREQLLVAVGRLMTERGSTEVSLSEIAQESGLNAALVKYYFGNKSGLLMALLRRALAPAIEQLDALVSMPIPPTDKLRIHVSGIVTISFKFPYVNRLMQQMLVEDPLLHGPMICEEIAGPVARAQQKILEEGARAGCFRAIDPMFFYFHIIGACDQMFWARYQLQRIFGVEDIDEALKRRYVDYLYDLLLHGVLNPTQTGTPALGVAI